MAPSLYISEKNRAIVVPATEQFQNWFPNAKWLDPETLVLPYEQPEYVMLRRLGYALPNPMMSYYDWPGPNKPFNVQRVTCSLMTANPRAYILNSMGTGKTRCACWSWDWLNKAGLAKKMLIVAKLSNLSFTWGAELFKVLPHRRYRVLGSPKGMTKRERLERLADPDAEVFIINHDGIKVIADELDVMIKAGIIDTLVIDELAAFRNNTDRSKTMRALAEKMKWAWGMTGSPMPNAPTDVWAQCKILTPHTVPKYFRHCQSMLMVKRDTYVWDPKPDAVESAYAMMQPAVRFNLNDVTELPDIVYRHIDVPLGKKQHMVYEALRSEFVADVRASVADVKAGGEGTINAVNAAALMSKLLQVAGGWVYAGEFGTIRLDPEPRQQMLLDLVEEADHKVLVFVPFRHACDGLSSAFTEAEIDHAVVHGDVRDRDQIFNKFQNSSKYKAIIAHPTCMSHGLTLTAADTIIWYLPTTSLETYEQANARIRRIGQQHRQQILHLQGTKVEKRVYTLLANKQKIQNDFLLMFEDATNSAI